MSEQQGVQSVEVGMSVLRALAAGRDPMTLKAVADGASMAPAKAHRYLVSLTRSGMVEQEPGTGRYRLGRTAVEVGLAAITGLDVMKFAEPAIAALKAEIDETVMVAVWGNRGPVVVRWADSGRPITTNIRTGSVMPMAASATGRLFSAYLPESETRELIEEEFRRTPHLAARWPGILAETRQHRLARVVDDMLPGLAALAAPVFDYQGEIVAVLATLGHQANFDSSWDGPLATALARAAGDLSGRMGYRAEAGTGVRPSAA